MSKPIGNKYEHILICSDIHGEFVDMVAWKCLLAVATENHWDTVILNGDTFDFPSISKHDAKIQRFMGGFLSDYTLEREFNFVEKKIFAPLRKAVGKKTRIVFRLGNHEERAISPSKSNKDALSQLVEFYHKRGTQKFPELCNFTTYDIDFSENGIDRLYEGCPSEFSIIHGVSTAANAANFNLKRYGSGTSGHTHSCNVAQDMAFGKRVSWTESGCLRTVKDIEYLPRGSRTKWCNAFVSLLINEHDFDCKQHIIVNDRVIFHDGIYM